jgi:hypothetical protein
MANPDNPNGFYFRKDAMGGTTPLLLTVKVATGQTIAIGDALILNASGLVQIALSTSGALYGVAVEAVSSAAAGATIKMVPFMQGYIFTGQCSGTLTQAIIGTSVDIEGTTGIMEINENAVVEQVVRILALDGDIDNLQTPGLNSQVLFSVARSQYDGLVAAL